MVLSCLGQRAMCNQLGCLRCEFIKTRGYLHPSVHEYPETQRLALIGAYEALPSKPKKYDMCQNVILNDSKEKYYAHAHTDTDVEMTCSDETQQAVAHINSLADFSNQHRLCDNDVTESTGNVVDMETRQQLDNFGKPSSLVCMSSARASMSLHQTHKSRVRERRERILKLKQKQKTMAKMKKQPMCNKILQKTLKQATLMQTKMTYRALRDDNNNLFIQEDIREDSIPLPIRKLNKFMRMWHILDNMKGLDKHFEPMKDIERFMAVSALRFIVGDAEGLDAKLRSIISPYKDLRHANHMKLNTPRQCAKTTTFGKMCALFIIASDIDATEFIRVFSIKKDSTKKIIEETRKFVKELMRPENMMRHGYDIKVLKTSTEELEIQHTAWDGRIVSNNMKAMPGKADACRGSAPWIAITDEFEFCDESLIEDMLKPLFTVSGRCWFAASTAAAPEGWCNAWDEMIEKQNKAGNYWMTKIDYKWACDWCMENSAPTACKHNLFYIPPFKTLFDIDNIRNITSERNRQQFEVETYGLRNEGIPILINRDHWYKTLNDKRLSYECELDYLGEYVVDTATRQRICHYNPHVYIFLDPGSHGTSEMGLVAIIFSTEGQPIVIGVSQTLIGFNNASTLYSIMDVFLTRVRGHKYVGPESHIVPIIEVQNNDYMPNDIMENVFYRKEEDGMTLKYGPILNPWYDNKYNKTRTSQNGVFTGRQEKDAGVGELQRKLELGQLRFCEHLAVTDKSTMNARRYEPTSIEEELLKLTDGVLNYRADPKNGGLVHGKWDGIQDDSATALMLCLVWAAMVRKEWSARRPTILH